jgi:hypothetical protein
MLRRMLLLRYSNRAGSIRSEKFPCRFDAPFESMSKWEMVRAWLTYPIAACFKGQQICTGFVILVPVHINKSLSMQVQDGSPDRTRTMPEVRSAKPKSVAEPSTPLRTLCEPKMFGVPKWLAVTCQPCVRETSKGDPLNNNITSARASVHSQPRRVVIWR